MLDESPLAVSVVETAGTELCVSSDDGQKVHDQVAAVLRGGKRVELSFLNVQSLTSAFLNAAIGQLYGEFSEDQVKGLLSVKDMELDDLALLKRVVDTAKEYFRDPERLLAARRAETGESDADED